jgi:AraC-like DNA-binding protein
MALVVRPRAAVLAPFVRSIAFYAAEVPVLRRERNLPSGDTDLLVNLDEDELRTYDGPEFATVRRVGGAAMAGARTTYSVIDTAEQRHVAMVNFRPGGAAPFFAMPAGEMQDRLVDLGDLWGRAGAVLRERLCEAATPAAALQVLEDVLLDHVATALVRDPAVDFAIRALERGVSVTTVTARLGVSPNRFARRFRDHVGLTPKRFSRVRRLQRLLRDAHTGATVDWSEVAARHGYFDQSHLIHDFRALTGLTPAAYRDTVRDARNHVPVPDGPFSPIAAHDLRVRSRHDDSATPSRGGRRGPRDRVLR